ncbi:MAG: hypothetical protein CVT63_00085 [Candidatus Anoxymicrobium japonicum]|uniref:YfhO family protein n=1 Tax=Candidatus Anoxymicrobium japonicum TaxID=2013648 RepID=A0A2N3G8B1_9ACTN|nr:MAG: hypothetical protein CVT63_00085 [Candidatus Anoxymicrobium japonicum]
MKEKWGKKDWLVLLGLLALATLAWSRVLFMRQWSFGIETDFIRQFYPARVYATGSLASGVFPLWNPHVLSGHPFFASYQTAMLYPLNLLMVGSYAAAGATFPLKALCVFVVFHFFLAGAFTYILSRDLVLGRAGSTVAAVTFMFSGYLAAHAGHINQVSAAAWMPLIFFLFNRALERRRFSWAVGAGVALAAAILAGHVQPVFYLCALLAGLTLFRAWQHYRCETEGTGIAFGIASLAITVAVGAGLAAAQLFPMYELIGLSTRSRMPFDIARTSSLPRWQTLNLVFPKFFGANVANYTGGWFIWETYGYCGIVGGALGIVALLRRQRAFVLFLMAALVGSLILALGPAGYIYTLLFKAGFFVNRFRNPARILVVFAFTSALLAGLGADHIVRTFAEEGRARYAAATRLVGFLAALLLILTGALSVFLLLRGGKPVQNGIAFKSMIMPVALLLLFLGLLTLARRVKLNARTLAIGILLLVAVDLIAQNVPWVMVKVKPGDFYGDAAASRYVASQHGAFRVETDAHTMYKSLDNGPLYGLDKATGDDSLVLADYNNYREIILPQVSPGVQIGLFYDGALNSPMLDPLNDAYFLTRQPINPVLLRQGKLKLDRRMGGVYVYRNTTILPRAWMSDARAYSDNQRIYDELVRTRGKDIRSTALVVMPDVAASRGQGAPVPAVKRPVVLRERSAHRLLLECDPISRGLLVLSEMYYPGWQAYIDGRKAETFKTDLMLRGVMLPGGQKEVEFRFEPRSLRMGIAVSLTFAALLLLYFGILVFASLRQPAREEEV